MKRYAYTIEKTKKIKWKKTLTKILIKLKYFYYFLSLRVMGASLNGEASSIERTRVGIVLEETFPGIRDLHIKIEVLTSSQVAALLGAFDDAHGEGYAVDTQKANDIWGSITRGELQ